MNLLEQHVCVGPVRCKLCHAAYMRRRYSELSPEEKFKANARAYANVYQRRGKLKRQPCENCGASDAEKHHDDYTQPLSVRWLCRDCHKRFHILSKFRASDCMSLAE